MDCHEEMNHLCVFYEKTSTSRVKKIILKARGIKILIKYASETTKSCKKS